MKDLYLSNDYYEVIENKDGDCFVKDKNTNRYYFQRNYFISKKIEFDKIEKVTWNWKDSLYLCLIALSIMSAALIIISYNNIYSAEKFTNKMYILSVVYLIISIGIHEMAHVVTMSFYKRKYGKIRFKFFYHIFPAVVTDTTDSYILPQYRRAFVYGAGIMSNLLMYGLTLLLVPSAAYLLRIVIWGVVYNLIPFGGMKTDGYHIFVNTILNVKDLKGKKNITGEIAKYMFLLFSLVTLVNSILRCLGMENFF